jgi:hypothetical protein
MFCALNQIKKKEIQLVEYLNCHLFDLFNINHLKYNIFVKYIYELISFYLNNLPRLKVILSIVVVVEWDH